ncbi:unnamed protein product [Ilex paraguariensis]|uniref:Uncharacterized protein n=1 Tax=Ilex paraguariensis TaxID=185542 RepID=A0ABC8SVS6_9AQUA
MVVATKLLARRNLIDTGKQFNMIAAAWIQFMIHDWIDHLEDTQQIELTAPREVANECPLKSFKFYKTKEVPTCFYEIKSGFLNTRTPWWLVTSAVIAKIHTIDWTVELLKTDTLLAGMRANWYGLLGKKFKDTFGHIGGASLGGLVGLNKPENHGVPYSLTEEFVSVYRMHSLLPDHLLLRDVNGAPGSNKSPPLIEKRTSLIRDWIYKANGFNGPSSLWGP